MAHLLASTRVVGLFKPVHASQSQRRHIPQHRQIRPTASVQASKDGVTRREGALPMFLAAAALLTGKPAKAFLGFGEPSADEIYARDTGNIIKSVLGTLSIAKDDPKKEDAVKEVRQQTNAWVARYRRSGFGGRPSYGNTYSALNALAGHYNSFGLTTPLPKKRLDRITKELTDAEKLLGRGR